MVRQETLASFNVRASCSLPRCTADVTALHRRGGGFVEIDFASSCFQREVVAERTPPTGLHRARAGPKPPWPALGQRTNHGAPFTFGRPRRRCIVSRLHRRAKKVIARTGGRLQLVVRVRRACRFVCLKQGRARIRCRSAPRKACNAIVLLRSASLDIVAVLSISSAHHDW